MYIFTAVPSMLLPSFLPSYFRLHSTFIIMTISCSCCHGNGNYHNQKRGNVIIWFNSLLIFSKATMLCCHIWASGSSTFQNEKKRLPPPLSSIQIILSCGFWHNLPLRMAVCVWYTLRVTIKNHLKNENAGVTTGVTAPIYRKYTRVLKIKLYDALKLWLNLLNAWQFSVLILMWPIYTHFSQTSRTTGRTLINHTFKMHLKKQKKTGARTKRKI